LADLPGERGLAGLPGAEERDNRRGLQLTENLLPVSCPLDHGRMLSLKFENAIFDFRAKESCQSRTRLEPLVEKIFHFPARTTLPFPVSGWESQLALLDPIQLQPIVWPAGVFGRRTVCPPRPVVTPENQR
jgi:hypothetical protein